MQNFANLKNRLWQPRKHPGYTGIEFLAPIASVLLVYLLGLPIYNMLTDRGPEYLLQEISLVSHLEYARQEAIRQQTVVTICPSRDGRNCQIGGDWTQGWMIFTDEASPPYHRSVGDQLLHRQLGYVGQQPLVATMDLIQYQADGSIRLF
jgi:Tfp pilus assembly protein FimT